MFFGLTCIPAAGAPEWLFPGVLQLHQDPSRAICEAVAVGFRLREALDPVGAPAECRKDLQPSGIGLSSPVVEHGTGPGVVEATRSVGYMRSVPSRATAGI